MANPAPQFWSQRVRVVEQQVMGKEKNHAKLTVTDGTGEKKVLAWHWAPHVPLPEWVDIAYTLRPNEFQGQTTLELQLLGVRYPIPQLEIKPPPAPAYIPQCVPLENLEHMQCLSAQCTNCPLKRVRFMNRQCKALSAFLLIHTWLLW